MYYQDLTNTEPEPSKEVIVIGTVVGLQETAVPLRTTIIPFVPTSHCSEPTALEEALLDQSIDNERMD